jgi:hypothetical protein
MAKKLLPSDYLGSDYSVSSSKMLINPLSLTGSGLTADEIIESATISLTNSGTLTIGLTYTIIALGSATTAEWNTIGWNGTSSPTVGDTFTALTTGTISTGTGATVKSGDVRRILMGIVEAAYQKYQTYTTAGTAPAKMFIGRSSSINDTTGILTRNYTLTFQTDISSVEVTEE